MNMVAMVLAGGAGTRFWPLSRRDRPKQLLSLGNHPQMLRATLDRLEAVLEPRRIFVITADAYRDRVKEIGSELPEENILAEPEGRDTAACSGLGALVARRRFGPETVIGTFPADHAIECTDKFTVAVETAVEASRELESLITLGIQPTHPSTGYGYIRYDENRSFSTGGEFLHPVEEFTEKPDRNRAMKLIEEENALWNSGMFFWTASTILREIEQYLPELARGLEEMNRARNQGRPWDEVMRDLYGSLPALSIDYGILEPTDSTWVLPVDFSWNDLGTWDKIESLFELDDRGNIRVGETVQLDTDHSVLYSKDGPLIGTIGVSDTIVIATEDAVLVCPKGQAQEVKTLVQKLEEEGYEHLL